MSDTNVTGGGRRGISDADLRVVREVRQVILQPSMRTKHLTINQSLLDALQGDDDDDRHSELRELLDNPPTRRGRATRRADGRRVPVVIGIVRDVMGRTRGGVRMVLEDADGGYLDSMRTTPAGRFALTFPARPDVPDDEDTEAEPATGRIRTVVPGIEDLLNDVEIAPDRQHEVLEIVAPDLGIDRIAVSGDAAALTGTDTDPTDTDVPTDTTDVTDTTDTDDTTDTTDDTTDTTDTTDDVIDLTDGGGALPIDPAALAGDDPFDVLPVDMSPELCHDVGRLFGSDVDTILTNPSKANDFRSRRTRIIKRVTVPRLGPAHPTGDEPPKRYLVTLRQEWKFLGYTLGEVSEIDSLDPGQVIDMATRTVSTAVDRTTSSAQEVRRQATSLLQSSLSRLSSVDTLVDVATSTRAETDSTVTTSTGAGVGPKDKTGAIVGGIIGGVLGGPLGALVGGMIGSGGVAADVTNVVDTHTAASLDTRAITRTDVHTSLEVNSMTRSAQSLVNTAISQVSSAVRSLKEATDTEIERVSPLLSKVTNLLRWRLYENYAVCSAIEDVVEVRDYEIFNEPADDDVALPLFSDEDIVEYRRFFEPNLLEPRLAPHFRRMARGIQQERSEDVPVTALRIAARFSTNGISGGRLAVSVTASGSEQTVYLRLRPGSSYATGALQLEDPIEVGDLGNASVQLTIEPRTVQRIEWQDGPLGIRIPIPVTEPDPNARVSITSLDIGYLPISARTQRISIGTELTATTETPSASDTIDLEIPDSGWFPEYDPLFIHINRNKTYYFSLLLQAAKDDPALRDDVPHLVGASIDGDPGLLDSNSPLWRLPIVGFEANRILIAMDVDDKDDFGLSLIDDPGAGTLVQLAAPGAYSEALEGLLSLTDAVGKLHPGVLPIPAPQMPPLALVDLAGRNLQVIDGVDTNGGGAGPTP